MPDRFYIAIFYHNTHIAPFFYPQKMLDMALTPVSAFDVMPSSEENNVNSFDVKFLRP
jgi:hypothetical protein